VSPGRGDSVHRAMSDLSRVIEAAKRLERAVLRVEAAMEHTVAPADGAGLARALADAKAQYASLSRVTETVASRLDQAIGRIDRVLEG
jgi:hypothetical protein